MNRPSPSLPLPPPLPRMPAGVTRPAPPREPRPAPRPAGVLWLHLHLPQLPLEVLTRGLARERACMLVAGEGTRRRVELVNTRAATLGIRAGMPLEAAHALGDVLACERNERAETQALASLGAWAMQWTSQVSLVAPDGLLLEIKGSLRLFRGLDSLLAQVRPALKELGYRVQYAVAPTPLAATLLARSATRTVVRDVHELVPALQDLPVTSLRLPPAQQAALDSIGVRRLGECRRLARGDFARRLSPAVLELLDRLHGQLPDPRPAFVLPPVFRAALELPWEVRQAQALVTAGERLLHELVGYLRAHAALTRRLRWCLRDRTGQRQRFEIRLSHAGREHAHLALLLREMLSRMQLKAPACAIELEVDDLVTGLPEQGGDLFGQRPAGSGEAYAAFADRLRARYGEQALQRVGLCADHRPELAWRSRSGEVAGARQSAVPAGGVAPAGTEQARPLWLVKEPITLPTQRGLPQFDGPLRLVPERERIEAGWWDGNARARDYFVATTTRGGRLWIYKELDGERRWRLHGVFE